MHFDPQAGQNKEWFWWNSWCYKTWRFLLELKSDLLILSYKDLLFSYDPLVTILNNNKNIFAKLFGVPFDFTSTYRSGSRFAPNAIRESFMKVV